VTVAVLLAGYAMVLKCGRRRCLMQSYATGVTVEQIVLFRATNGSEQDDCAGGCVAFATLSPRGRSHGIRLVRPGLGIRFKTARCVSGHSSAVRRLRQLWRSRAIPRTRRLSSW
jgi:hypothetical protein